MKEFLIILILSVLIGCHSTDERHHLIERQQISLLLEDFPSKVEDELTSINNDLSFWRAKLQENPKGFLYAEKLAPLFNRRFELQGTIEDIDSSSHYLQLAIELRNGWKTTSLYHACINNLFKKHRFEEARNMCLRLLGEKPQNLGLQLLLFDAFMELGEYNEAQKLIVRLSKTNQEFDLILRQAKFFDHQGNLARTIELMHQADSLAMKSSNRSIQSWTKTMLGEYLTHNGEFSKGVNYFLRAIELDPTQEFAWLNLAWMVYVHDQDQLLYEEIIRKLNVKITPDRLWDLAELYSDSDDRRYGQLIMEFYEEATLPKYKGLYEPKIALIESEYLKNHQRACQLAQEQVQARPTYESYDLLSWCLFQAGEFDSARSVYQAHLINKTSEPLIQYHGGEIYFAKNELNTADWLLSEASEAQFELGPKIHSRIKYLTRETVYMF